MPRLVSSKQLPTQLRTTLTITGSFAAGFTAAYDQNRIRCPGPVEILNIALVNQARGTNASFQDYACTNPDALTTDVKTPFEPGTDGVTFKLNLRANELIDFAMFVVMSDPTGANPPVTLFCDPQVGNDPD